MIFKEVGQTMDLLLVKVAEEHHIDAGVVEKILQVEKDHVYQKSRHNASIREGTPQKLEHNDIRWIKVDEIDGYDFCPADEVILRKLKTIK